MEVLPELWRKNGEIKMDLIKIKWIPVSERFPEKELYHHKILVSTDGGDIEMTRFYRHDNGKPRFAGFDDGQVVAWAYLPKPYLTAEKPPIQPSERTCYNCKHGAFGFDSDLGCSLWHRGTPDPTTCKYWEG